MKRPPAFFIGANLPWIRYGGDFGANRWAPAGGISQHPEPERIRTLFETLRETGVTAVRWFVLCDGRAAVRFRDDGMPAGLNDRFWPDMDTALDWTAAAGMTLLPVLLDFHWCHPRLVVNEVTTGGRRAVLSHGEGRRALIEHVLAPIFQRYADDSRIFAWDLINEPEWVTFGLGTWNPFTSISRMSLRAYVADAAARAHALARQPVTVGSASVRWLPALKGLDLDFYQPHWYDRFERRSPLATPVGSLGCDRPVILGEFPTRGSERSPEQLIETARAAGYDGALFWSVLAEDGATDFASARTALKARMPDTARDARNV